VTAVFRVVPPGPLPKIKHYLVAFITPDNHHPLKKVTVEKMPYPYSYLESMGALLESDEGLRELCEIASRRVGARPILDWLLKQPGLGKPRSVAGYLVQSIREGYDTPPGFHEPRGKRTSPRQSGKKPPQSRKTRLQRQVAAHLKKLPDAEQHRLEQLAMASAEKPMLEAYQRASRAHSALCWIRRSAGRC